MTLVRREVAARYRGSLFGNLWALFTPLFMLAVYTFIFSVVFKARWSGGSDSRSEFAWPCCTIPKQDSSLSGADFAQLTCCRTGIPNPVILLIAFTHASASPTCAL